MPDKYVPLEIPPGLFMNGTMAERKGRWADGNLVRFNNGVPAPMYSWSTLSTSSVPPADGGNSPCGAFAWTPSDNLTRVVVGKNNKLYVIKQVALAAVHTLTDITPTGLVSSSSSFDTFWTFAVLGENLLAARHRAADGPNALYTWDIDAGDPAVVVTGAGAARAVVVTPEQFVVVIQTHRNIAWASQGTDNVWTPTSTNSAGGLTIPGTSRLITGKAVKGQTILWSKDDAVVLEYVGAPLYYGSRPLGSGTGIIGPRAAVVVKDTAYWMGPGGFFKYDGFVQQIPCDIADSIFTPSLQRSYGNRFFALVNSPQNEIWWFYATGQVIIPNQLAIYNYENQTWSRGVVGRTAGTNAEWHDQYQNSDLVVPILFDSGDGILMHENSAAAATGAYIESGPYEISDGDQTVLVDRLVLDDTPVGDQITLFGGTYPEAAEVTNGPYTAASSNPISVRFRARYARYKQTLTSAVSRVGIPKLGVIPSSRR